MIDSWPHWCVFCSSEFKPGELEEMMEDGALAELPDGCVAHRYCAERASAEELECHAASEAAA